MTLDNTPYAVVVGLCAHGLSVARALHGAGVRVIALDADNTLPGVRTRCADVRIIRDINTADLVGELTQLVRSLGNAPPPVLFLTNDRMVEVLSAHIDSIAEHYRLSWAASAQRLAPLLHKDNLESRCIETGLHYPRTRRVVGRESAAATLAGLRLPVILKPTKPLSSFKTLMVNTPAALDDVWARIGGSLPVIAQEFIPGDDTRIRFGALYLRDGEILARFEGRKLRSRPMGHTTIAISERNDAVHELTLRFFRGLRLSGPVSLELKQDFDGNHWVIEPTVGRTDFWVGLCIANQVNFPLIEYLSATSQPLPGAEQTSKYVWINGERDPAAIAWLLAHHPGTVAAKRFKGVYADRRDTRPFIAALTRDLSALPLRGGRKLRRLLAGS